MSSRPSGVHFMTRWASRSTVQIFPSGPTRKPCGFLPRNSGHARRNLPDLSNCITGCGPSLKTHTLSLVSTSTAATSFLGRLPRRLGLRGPPTAFLRVIEAGENDRDEPGKSYVIDDH